MVVENVNVVVDGIPDISEHEVKNYIRLIQEKTHENVSSLRLVPAENGQVTVNYELQEPKFERIRRITGYLVGTIDRWNDAKQAEEHDRVKHTRCCN